MEPEGQRLTPTPGLRPTRSTASHYVTMDRVHPTPHRKVLRLFVIIKTQIVTVVHMKTVMVVHLPPQPAVLQIAVVHRGRGRTIDHLTQACGKTGALGGRHSIRTTGQMGLIRFRTNGPTGDTLGPLEDGPQEVTVQDRVDLGTARLGSGSMHPSLVNAHHLRIRTEVKTVHLHLQLTSQGEREDAMYVVTLGATLIFIHPKNVRRLGAVIAISVINVVAEPLCTNVSLVSKGMSTLKMNSYPRIRKTIREVRGRATGPRHGTTAARPPAALRRSRDS